MGRPEHDGAASPFGSGTSPPLSGASSPWPLLPVPNDSKARFGGRRRHAVVRLICSPFAAVFGTGCASRAGAAANDEQATRRPSLEELLRMEASSNLVDLKKPSEPEMIIDPYADDHDSWKQSAIVVFDLSEDGDKNRRIEAEKDEAPLPVSEYQHGAITCPDDEKEPAEELDAGTGGGAMLSPKALVNVERLVVVLASLGARAGALKGSYGRLAAGRRVGGADDGKAELFYDRPIPLGRRCRVQHLEESPYL